MLLDDDDEEDVEKPEARPPPSLPDSSKPAAPLAIKDKSPSKPEPVKFETFQEGLYSSGDEKIYETGFDAAQGRAWRKERLGPRTTGPLEWCLFPEPDLHKEPHDSVICVFEDGLSVEIPHMTQDSFAGSVCALLPSWYVLSTKCLRSAQLPETQPAKLKPENQPRIVSSLV